MTATVHARITRFEYSCIPEDHPDAHAYTITVEYRGRDTWAICWAGRGVWGTDGRWDYEPLPSSRSDEWLAAHRFPLEQAQWIALCQAPELRIMGYGVSDILNDESTSTKETAVEQPQSDTERSGAPDAIHYTLENLEAVKSWLGDAYKGTRGGLQDDDPLTVWFSTGPKALGPPEAWARPNEWIVRHDGLVIKMTQEQYRHVYRAFEGSEGDIEKGSTQE